MVIAVEEAQDVGALDVDAHLRPLLLPLDDAITNLSRVAVLSLWSPIRVAALLASHLHLRWPGKVTGLPLNPYLAMLPFQGTDWDLCAEAIYSVSDSQIARQSARVSRNEVGELKPGDLHPTDWEQVAGKFRGPLPAESYISFDRLMPCGAIRRGSRRIVGKRVPRRQPKPTVLVPSELLFEKTAYEQLEKCDAVIINAQNVRGRRTGKFLASTIEALTGKIPVLILAASPADLASVGFVARPRTHDRIIILTEHVASISARAFLVGQDRLSAEREFSFSIDGIEERSQELKALTVLGRRAWWATRQMLSLGGEPREVERFQRLLEYQRTNSLDDVDLLNDCARLIQRETVNASAHLERRTAVVQAALNDGKAQKVLVIVKPGVVRDTKRELSEVLGVCDADLQSLGIYVQSAFDNLPLSTFDTCVPAGYFGPATIDLALASRAERIHFVVDPIEARVAIWDLQTRFRQYYEWLPESAQQAISILIRVLTEHAARETDTLLLSSLEDFKQSSREPINSPRGQATHASDQVLIEFSDGQSMEATPQTRFIVLGKSKLRLQSVSAKDLQPGYQVVLVEQDSREEFSEIIFRAVDGGKYQKQSSTRKMWLHLVHSMCTDKGLTPTKISRLLRRRGCDVDATTVRGWIKSPDAEESSVPERLIWFRTFAESLGIVLPQETLDGWFKDIKQLRIAHRNVGRDLARAIRGAYLGQLAAPTLQKIERDWGVNARDLIAAARVATVEEVILPEIGVINDAE